MAPLLRSLFICCACLLLAGCGASQLASQSKDEDEDGIAAAFRMLRTPPERLPPSLAHHVARLLKTSDGEVEPVNTQLVRTREGAVWIFLTSQKMCLVQADFGSISCSKKRLARSQGVVLGTFKPPSKDVPRMHEFLVVGALPDDVRYVSATIGRHLRQRHVRVAVRNNVLAIAAEQPVLVRGFGRR